MLRIFISIFKPVFAYFFFAISCVYRELSNPVFSVNGIPSKNHLLSGPISLWRIGKFEKFIFTFYMFFNLAKNLITSKNWCLLDPHNICFILEEAFFAKKRKFKIGTFFYHENFFLIYTYFTICPLPNPLLAIYQSIVVIILNELG